VVLRERGSSPSSSTISSPSAGPERHRDRDGAVQLDDRRPRDLDERVVERDDALQSVSSPVRARAWHAAIAAWSA
jgi:hypothetical protein